MNYRHAYHAGNFADVLKHAALVAVLQHLSRKPAAFAVIDTHAGRGLYDLGGKEAMKTGEAQAGIVKLLARNDLSGPVAAYVALVRGFGEGRYPGSPLIAARLLRQQDRLVAVEKHPEECAELTALLSEERRARVICGDGYAALAKLVPPAERRGVVLIDPPYEAENEFETASRALAQAYRRFATGIFLFWYPAKERPRARAAAGELVTAGIKELLRLELDIGVRREERLSATGLLVVNPPFGFAAEMQRVGGHLARVLGEGENTSFRSDVLAGEG
jgi:23S rRNA (adenine2030-N6)-methyltransferase